MDFIKFKNIPGIAVFLDFGKAFDSIEWDFIRKCLESFNFGPNLRQWISVFYKDISSCVIDNGAASKHFYLERGVRQDCPLSGILYGASCPKYKTVKRHQGHTHPSHRSRNMLTTQLPFLLMSSQFLIYLTYFHCLKSARA